jgi:hypothetical protein
MGLRRATARWRLGRLLRTGGMTAGIVEELHRREWTTRAIRRVRLSRVRPFRLAGTRWRLPEPPSMTAIPDFRAPDTDYPEWAAASAPRVAVSAPPWSASPAGSAWRSLDTGPAWPTPSLHDIRTAAARTAARARYDAGIGHGGPATIPGSAGVSLGDADGDAVGDGAGGVAGGAAAPTADIRNTEFDRH